jgi:class 3 adenylate cyclase/pimeloyl-ACP methyl ester carboxylesterase
VIPETAYVEASEGVFVAYQVVGAGPVDVSMDFHAFAGNVDLIWDEPDWGPLLAQLSEFARVIVHDRRGTGASTRNVSPPNLETRSADLLAVLDAVGSKTPVLAAAASTGAMHALFAASHPGRVSGVLWNYPRPRLAWAPDYPWGQGPDVFQAELERAALWGTTEHAQDLALLRAAQRAGIPDDERFTLRVDEERARRYARVTRNTVSPDVAEALTRMAWQTDVRDVLASVHAPTALVVGEGDPPAQLEEAEYVASLMPNAKVHVLPGRSGLAAELVDITRQLAGMEATQHVSTALCTVLFTDIVDSTRKQAELGDRRWRELVLAHHAAVRQTLARWRGHEHDTAGDGFYASFSGPARAIHCAHEIVRRVSDLGIEVRAGVHIGECEIIDGKPGGLAVTIGARALAIADRSQVVVTQTVKDLVAGSGFSFADRGDHELKGVPGSWRLYTVKAVE